jgi:hypothetical protein
MLNKKMNSSKDNRVELKKRKMSSNALKQKKLKPKSQIELFDKIFITEKDKLNKSQKNFLNSPKIKIGHR